MTDPTRLRVDPGAYRLDGRFFRRIYKLSRPYWTRKDSWGSWAALGFLCILAIFYSLAGAWYSFLTKNQTNALVARQSEAFWHFLTLSLAFLAVRYLSYVVQAIVSANLNQHWRRWLTTHLIDEYLARRTYYAITLDKKIDNPDQRIQEEVTPFCQTMANLPTLAITMVADMGVQAFILMTISVTLFWAVIAFAAIKTVAILLLYKPTIKQNYDVTVSEADLRYGILHVRDHAETVAFYRGEYAERTHILARLSTAVQKNLIKLIYAAWMNLAQYGFGLVWTALPLLFLAPLFLRHEIAFGVIAQGTASSATLLQSLSLFMTFIPTLTEAVPKVIRLAEIQEKFEELGLEQESRAALPRVHFTEGDEIALKNVSLETPGGEQKLGRGISFHVGPRESLLIVGQTGVGKSSLLRAMAGLWTRGTGDIVMPAPDEALFLPQKPYMILANLREQLLYPRHSSGIGDDDLQAILERVSLHDLASKHGGFDAEKDWGRVLSLGEQQRIGFARVLVSRPKFVFLDEATSAVDIETERLLYGLLARSGATYVSVGHRPSIVGFHEKVLRLLPGGSWEIVSPRAILEADSGTGGGACGRALAAR